MDVRGSFRRISLKWLSVGAWAHRPGHCSYILNSIRPILDNFHSLVSPGCSRSASSIRKNVLDGTSIPGEASHSLSSDFTKIPASKADDVLRVYIVAGEPSGDAIGSRLMNSLRNLIVGKSSSNHIHAPYILSHESAAPGACNKLAGRLRASHAASGSRWGEEREGYEKREEDACVGAESGRDTDGCIAVRKQWRDVCFAGIGGPWMTSQGLQSLFPMSDLTVMGFTDVIMRLPLLRMRLKTAVDAAVSFQPHVLVTIDSKGFSYRLHRAVRDAYSRKKMVSPAVPAPATAALTAAEAAAAGAAAAGAVVSGARGTRPASEATLRPPAAAAAAAAELVGNMLSDSALTQTQEGQKHSGGTNPPVAVQYVAPSFWAWKGGEASLKRWSLAVDHMFCILPSEPATCHQHGLSASYVGHPSLEESWTHGDGVDGAGAGDAFRILHRIECEPQHIVLGVFLGSRSQEVSRMLPIVRSAIHQVTSSSWLPSLLDSRGPRGSLSLVLPTLPEPSAVVDLIRREAASWDVTAVVVPASQTAGHSDGMYHAMDAAVCVSGSVVMDLLRCHVPSIVVYKSNWFNQLIVRLRARICFACLPNLLLDTPAIPELLFSNCTAQRVAAAVRSTLEDLDGQRANQRVTAEKVYEVLREGRGNPTNSLPSERAVLQLLSLVHQQHNYPSTSKYSNME